MTTDANATAGDGNAQAAADANTEAGYAIVDPEAVQDAYDDSSVPGEFRSLTESLESRQLAVTFIRVPAHSDFEQGSGHFHEEIEELYLICKGTLTMRFGEQVRSVCAPAAVRVDPKTARSHRNEGDEPVEMWAVSRRLGHGDATKIDDFWPASPQARQTA
jgi:mannose-6-phosphate isomerase-like protein (cupin superfamily)